MAACKVCGSTVYESEFCSDRCQANAPKPKAAPKKTTARKKPAPKK